METIHLLEVFGGVGALARGMREKGLLAEIFDIRQSKFDNIHTESGLMRLCKLLSSVLPSPKGLCVIEPTCSSWEWVNRGTSLRSVDPCFQSAWNGVWGIARPCQDNFKPRQCFHELIVNHCCHMGIFYMPDLSHNFDGFYNHWFPYQNEFIHGWTIP